MVQESLAILYHLGAAWLAGSLIGLERSFHGRPAGFRTHALVCGASALLMIVSTNQWQWLDTSTLESTIRTDPTRMAQGIMTGIGFLGAGVIFKEGLNVHGLTTAASIWITAVLGILFGVGFWLPAVVATVSTLLTLSLFRWVEQHLPSEYYADHVLGYAIEKTPSEEQVRELLGQHGCVVKSMSYSLGEHGAVYRYHMVLQTKDRRNLARLAGHLRHSSRDLLEFRLSSAGE